MNLKELREAAEKATPGERHLVYAVDEDHNGSPWPRWMVCFHNAEECWKSDDSTLLNEQDASYIALANPTAILQLLDAYERLQTAVDWFRAAAVEPDGTTLYKLGGETIPENVRAALGEAQA